MNFLFPGKSLFRSFSSEPFISFIHVALFILLMLCFVLDTHVLNFQLPVTITWQWYYEVLVIEKIPKCANSSRLVNIFLSWSGSKFCFCDIFVSFEVKVCNVMIITVECLPMATLAQGPEKIVPVTISCTDTTCNRTTYMWLIVCFILVLCPKQTVPWMWMEVHGELLLCTKDLRLKLKLGKLWGQKTWYIWLWNLSRR